MWWLDAQRESVARKRPWYDMVMIQRRIRIGNGPEIIFCPSDSSQSSLSYLNFSSMISVTQFFNGIPHCHPEIHHTLI